MKKILVLSALLLVASAPAFASGLNIAWSGCPGDPAALPNIADVCVNRTLLGTFDLDQAISNVTAMDYVIDVETIDPVLPPIWQRSTGECHPNSIAFSTAHNGASDNCAGVPMQLSGDGFDVSVSSASWFSGPAVAAIPDNRGKLVGSIVRSFPGNLDAGTQFGGKWVVRRIGTTCTGCETPGAVVWNSAVIFSTAAAGASPEAETNLEGPGMHSNCATFAGGGTGLPGSCDATPTQNTTWGQIKSLYR